MIVTAPFRKLFVNVAVVLCLCFQGARSQGFESEGLTSNAVHEASAWYGQIFSAHPNVHEVLRGLQEDVQTESLQSKEARSWLRKAWMQRNASGGLVSPATSAQYLKNWHYRSAKAIGQPQGSGTWKGLGPYAWDTTANMQTGSAGIGVIRCLTSATKQPTWMCAGTISAGVWNSTDAGDTWKCASLNTLARYVGDVSYGPSDAGIVYAATDVGVLKSVDGGNSFLYTTLNSALQFPNTTAFNFVSVSSTNASIVIAATNKQLQRTEDGGKTWRTVLETPGEVLDIEWHPTSGSIVYLLVNQGGWPVLFKSTDAGITYTPTGTGLPVKLSGHSIARGLIAVSKASPERLYTVWGGGDGAISGLYGLYVSLDGGANFSHKCCGVTDRVDSANKTTNPNLFDYSIDGNGLGQITWDMAFAVSNSDPNLMLVGGIFPYVSTNGGETWMGTQSIHYDVQDAMIVDSTIWVATDGGIKKSANFGATMEERSFGINSLEIWGFGQSHWNSVMALGAYHMPIMIRDDDVYGSMNQLGGWYSWSGADAMNADVNPAHDSWLYAKPWGSVRAVRTKNKAVAPSSWDLGIDLGYIPMSNICFHPNKTFTLVAADHASKSIKLSTDNARSWSTLRQHSGYVWKVKRSPSIPTQLVSIADEKLWLSANDGQDWMQITPPSSLLRGYAISDVEFSPISNTLWLTVGANQSVVKVLTSTNIGGSWADHSLNLEPLAIHCVAIQGDKDETVFVGTELGVFFTNASQNNWTEIGSNLPSTPVNFLNIDNGAGLLRAATNRGIFEIALPNTSIVKAVISRDIDTVVCSRQGVRFTDMSVIENSVFASRTWWFDGGSPATSSEQTVEVSYQVPGTYAARLKVRNDVGEDSTVLERAVVVLPSECSTFDSIPGNCVDLSTASDFAKLGRFSGSVQNFTFTAWVKPNGWQAPFSTILCTDADEGTQQEIGVQFADDSNRIGYLWKDGRWWWNSGLQLLPDVWSHVALVISAEGADVYVNGIKASDEVPLKAQDLSTLVFTLGTYHYWTSRNFNGQIDEVAMYNRSLDSNEIRERMHHCRRNTEASLMAYYQFNESHQGTFYEKVRGADGTPEQGAALKVSTIPVAPGITELTSSTTSGWLPNSTTVSTVFVRRNTSTVLNSSISWLRADPDSFPYDKTLLPKSYWIYHNYTPSTSASMESIRVNLSKFMQISDAAPRTFFLRTREALDHRDVWSTQFTNASGYYDSVNNDVTFTVADLDVNTLQWHVAMSGGPVSAVEDQRNSLVIYPQPSGAFVNVRGIPGNCRSVSVFDVCGSEVLRVSTMNQADVSLSVEQLSAGIYTLVAGELVKPLVVITHQN